MNSILDAAGWGGGGTWGFGFVVDARRWFSRVVLEVEGLPGIGVTMGQQLRAKSCRGTKDAEMLPSRGLVRALASPPLPGTGRAITCAPILHISQVHRRVIT